MNEAHGITVKNLMAALPTALAGDKSMVALAEAIAEALAERPEEIRKLLIYSCIDELPEELLDILAYDFKVDWWDADYSLEQKRRTLKESWYVHRILGTKAAVERAISAIYPDTKVQEWFEYGGKPYHFKLSINTTNADSNAGKRARVLSRLNYYKNLRSHLDGIDYYAQAEGDTQAHIGVAFIGACETITVHVPPPKGVDAPKGEAPAYIGVKLAGTLQTMTAKAEIHGDIHPPEYHIPAHIGVRVYGVHEKIETEVTVNGEI